MSCVLLLLPLRIPAEEPAGTDFYVAGYPADQRIIQLQDIYPFTLLISTLQNHTVLDPLKYQQVFNDARNKITGIINQMQINGIKSLNDKIAYVTQQLADVPYHADGAGATGEGDWQPRAHVYQGGAVHLRQDPIYRLDALNCQTLVQVIMGLLHATNLNEFDQSILKISYGAAGNPEGEIVHFYNRNNFPEGDFNPVNRRNGWLSDGTTEGELSAHVKTTSATITRQNWFITQGPSIRVLYDKDFPAMADRFNTVYKKLDYPHFGSEQITLDYIPKEDLAIKQANGSYQINQALIDQIPAPAVIEIVRDTKKWNIQIGTQNINIKDRIGSELSISHMGLLYHQTFQRGDTIFQKISCYFNDKQQKACQVVPVKCEQDQCKELMFAQATNAYPDGYYWYKQADQFVCSPEMPANHDVKALTCNRVERLPLSDYITRQQYTGHPFMDSESILGIHVEKIQ